jgi:hypothetical protein
MFGHHHVTISRLYVISDNCVKVKPSQCLITMLWRHKGGWRNGSTILNICGIKHVKSGGYVVGVRPHCHWKDRRVPTAVETAEAGCVTAMRTTELA